MDANAQHRRSHPSCGLVPVGRIPLRHALVVGACFAAAAAAVLITPRMDPAYGDPWLAAEQADGPLRIALGLDAEGRAVPARVVLPADEPRPRVLGAYPVRQAPAPVLAYGPAEPSGLTLGQLENCAGGSPVIAILELPAKFRGQAGTGYPVDPRDRLGRSLGPSSGLCILVDF